MSGPDISVVVATYSRSATLRRTLEHLSRQTIAADRYEIIVVDDGSPDDTAQVVAAVTPSMPCKLTFLTHPNRGPGFTQNRGIRQAVAPIVLLIADDIFLEPAALEAHLAAHARHGDSRVAILGRVMVSPEVKTTAFMANWDLWRIDNFAQDQQLPCMLFWACNISFNRQFMIEHGMFREHMGPGGAAGHEDVEVGYRLDAHGLRIFHERAALGYHCHPDTLESARKRSFQRGQNWEGFYDHLRFPELAVNYRVYGPGTLIRHGRELKSARSSYLRPSDRSLLRLGLMWLARKAVFNRLTVGAFWTPLLRLAERNPLAAALARPGFYRGVIVYEFQRGHRLAKRPAGTPQ